MIKSDRLRREIKCYVKKIIKILWTFFQRLPERDPGVGGAGAHVGGHHCLHPLVHPCLPTLCLGVYHC